jgi:hypothetical protein
VRASPIFPANTAWKYFVLSGHIRTKIQNCPVGFIVLRRSTVVYLMLSRRKYMRSSSAAQEYASG